MRRFLSVGHRGRIVNELLKDRVNITHFRFIYLYLNRYPVDSGAFLSASVDGCLKIWDTNAMQVPSYLFYLIPESLVIVLPHFHLANNFLFYFCQNFIGKNTKFQKFCFFLKNEVLITFRSSDLEVLEY